MDRAAEIDLSDWSIPELAELIKKAVETMQLRAMEQARG